MFEIRLETRVTLLSRATRLALIAGLLAAVVSCQTETDSLDPARTEAAITGGSPDTEFTGVCGIEVILPPDPDDPDMMRDPLWCSCTLVADRVVLTAAHCVEENLTAEECDDPGNTPPCDEDIDVRFGTSIDAATPVAHDEIFVHRYFDPDTPGVNDVAIIHLAEDPVATPTPVPVTLNDQPLDSSIEGTPITFVGFGVTASDAEDFGALRRRVEPNIRSVGDDTLLAGTATETPCRGDNGGPGFYDLGSGPVQIAINAVVTGCNQSARRNRVDVFTEDFIYPLIDRYVGACALDDTCVETGCRTPDPDCDTTGCSWDGECVEDCPTRDYDCDLGVFPRGACDQDGDCERGGRCIGALDDPDFTYCTMPCEVDDDCPANNGDMVCNADNECEFTIPSPGSQGRPCGDPGECRSGICEQDICVVECTTDADCPDAPAGETPYRCIPSDEKPGANVCIGTIVTGGGGFCDPNSVTGRRTGGAAGGFALLLLGAVALVIRTRRRR